MHSDTIHVIEGGQVVESGRHDDLLRRNGRYARSSACSIASRPLALASSNA